MRRLATQRGARFEAETAVTGLRVLDAGDGHGPGLVEVATSDRTLRARHVVAAVGSWAPALLGGHVALPTITVTQEQPRFFTARDEVDVATWPVFVHWRDEPGPHGRAAGYGCVEPGVGVKVGLHHSGPAVDPDRRPPPDLGLEEAVVDYVRRWFLVWTPTVRRRSAASTTTARTRCSWWTGSAPSWWRLASAVRASSSCR